MRGGGELAAIFPRLATVGTTTEGDGVNLVVHFTKKQGAPVLLGQRGSEDERRAIGD